MRRKTRLEILALPAAGFLAAVSTLPAGVFINPSTDPAGFAQASDSIGLGNLLGIVALVLLLVGVQALYSFLAETPTGKMAHVGILLTFAGIGLILPLVGIFAFAAPVAGRLYLNGDMRAVTVIADSTAVSNPVALLFGGMSALLFTIGSALLGIAIWYCGTLPKWSGIFYAVSSISIFSTAGYGSTAFTIAFVGSLLLFASGAWMAASITRRKTSPKEAGHS